LKEWLIYKNIMLLYFIILFLAYLDQRSMRGIVITLSQSFL
jgi:hypothetical protein